MKHAFVRLAAPLALGAAVSACSASTTAQGRAEASSAAPSEAQAKVTADVVAEGAGLRITAADLEQKLGVDRLMDMRQREYDLRKEALDALLDEKLLDKEAQARGLSVEQLRQREVEQKAEKPDRAEVERFYAQNQRRLAGMPKEQALQAVERALSSRNQEARATVFRRELIRKHRVQIRLEPPRYDVAVPADAPSLGPATAPITIVEFADYQCPFCVQAQAAVDEILKRYAGKVRLVHRDFPLDGIHPRATPAARASRCAGEQGKFWEYHRGLLAAVAELSERDLTARAEALGLNMTSFGSCLAQANDAPIRAGLADGAKLGVGATPTFFVNGRRLVGAKGVPDFVDVIEDELTRGHR